MVVSNGEAGAISSKESESLAKIARLEEQLRQERETFEIRKEQDRQWFNLRLRMGYAAAIMLPLVGAFCVYVIASHEAYAPSVVASVSAALLVDILGLLGAVWKIVLNSETTAKLEPVTRDNKQA